MTAALTLHPDHKGMFDEFGNVLTLTVITDVSVSRKGATRTFCDSKRLYVANDGGRGWQLLREPPRLVVRWRTDVEDATIMQ